MAGAIVPVDGRAGFDVADDDVDFPVAIQIDDGESIRRDLP